MKHEELISYLASMYDHFNDGLFGNKLRRLKFLISSQKRFSLRFSEPYEIRIGKEFQTISASELFRSMIHQMVHCWNYQHGIVDIGPNLYHNEFFANKCVELGLYVRRIGPRGWHETSFEKPNGKSILSPSLENISRRKEIVDSFRINPAVVDKSQRIMREDSASTPKQFLLKYVCKCPPPHNCIRSGRRPDGPNPPKIRCLSCNEIFVHDSFC